MFEGQLAAIRQQGETPKRDARRRFGKELIIPIETALADFYIAPPLVQTIEEPLRRAFAAFRSDVSNPSVNWS